VHQLQNALTVRQLIETLEGEDPNAVVVFACDYGDRSHTQQAIPVESAEKLYSQIRESAYSQSGLAVCDEDDEDECELFDGEQNVVILK
jgi:hypothetical protein